METSGIAFIWPWVGLRPQNMTKYGIWDGWVGTRYSTPPGPPVPTHPGYTLPTHVPLV